jgi:hypothetical protein
VATPEVTGTSAEEARSPRITAGPTITWRGVLIELGFVAIALVLNAVVRWYTLDDYALAVRNAADVFALEERLLLDWEHALQGFVLSVPGLATVSSWYYVYGYLPVVIGALVWLYVRHRDSYRLLRNSLLASGAVGLLGYAFYPTAPPRLTDFGFSDPVAAGALARAARPEGIANEIAAIPSFHIGWLMLVAIIAGGVVRHRWVRALLLLQPVVMSFVIIATANHWVLDIPAGLAIAAAGLAIAWWIESRRSDQPWGAPSIGPSDPSRRRGA